MQIDYPITRSFSWRWFTPISLSGSFIVIVILVVVNTALTGYETITVFQSDFNATQTSWRSLHDQLLVFPVERRLYHTAQCRTIRNVVLWYPVNLLRCAVYMDGFLLSWSVDFTVIASCVDSNLFNVTTRTSFSMGLLPGRYAPMQGVRLTNNGSEDIQGIILNALLSSATQDLGTPVYNALLFSNQSSAISFSAQVNFNYCPTSFGLNASCAVNPPQFDIFLAAIVFPNSTIVNYYSGDPINPVLNPWVLDNDTELAVYNILQTVYAAVRIDLGNPSSNNFILYPAAMNNTIYPTFPITPANGEAFSNSTLFSILNAPFPGLQPNPFPLKLFFFGSATIQCDSDLSPLVANRCCGHCPQHRLDLDPSFMPFRPNTRLRMLELFINPLRSHHLPPPHLTDLTTLDAEIDSINKTTSDSHETTKQ